MNRKQLIFLKNWLEKPNRKPLVVRGARQVGKSTLVRLFAEQQGLALAAVNLERHTELQAAFTTNDPIELVNRFESLPSMPLINGNTLLFLDEIQAAPSAIPALRYFYEDMKEIPVLAAGSLLEFVLADHNFSMPVGRMEYLHMGPMTFVEFLDAVDEVKLANEIKTWNWEKPINPVAHQRLLGLLRTYFFVGGMPEAVDVFAKTKKFRNVSDVHNSIIETYREDFPKYGGSRNLTRMLNVFNFAARNIGKKIKYSNISKDEQSATLKKDIDLLCMARVIAKVIHSHCSGLPLQADLEEKIYKLIFLDVGLMNAICGLGWNTLSQLDDVRLVNEGAIAEQFVGQHLRDLLSSCPNRELTYWLREGKSLNAEVDFVVAFDNRIIPIEVKAGATGSLKSLHQFAGEKKSSLAIRFDTNTPSVQKVETVIRKAERTIPVEYQLISLPLYLVSRLPDLIKPGSDAT
jgi:uncharacterized protein